MVWCLPDEVCVVRQFSRFACGCTPACGSKEERHANPAVKLLDLHGAVFCFALVKS